MKEEQIKLFEKWRPEYKNFIPDGIVDEQAYLDSPIKILYLLKEVNGGEDWDLCDFLKEGGRPQTWDNITRWTIGIHQWEREIQWSEIENITNEKRIETLNKICAVNVKKESGSSVADSGNLLKAVENDREKLQQQLAIYKPDLIVCCGTEWLYEKIYQCNLEWNMTSRGIWFARHKESIVISYSHPEARVKDCLLYYGLIDAVREILGKNKTA